MKILRLLLALVDGNAALRDPCFCIDEVVDEEPSGDDSCNQSRG